MPKDFVWVGCALVMASAVACHGIALRPYGCAEPDHGSTIGDEVSGPRWSCDGDVLVTQRYRCDEADGPVPDGEPTREDCTLRGMSCVDVGGGAAACAKRCKVNGDCRASEWCDVGLCAPAGASGEACNPNATDANSGPRCAPGFTCSSSCADCDAGGSRPPTCSL